MTAARKKARPTKRQRRAKSRGPGRPCKLTPETHARIVRSVADGCPREVAAQAAGIGETTLYAWMQRGDSQPRGRFREFREAIKAAEAQAIESKVGVIRAAEAENWTAAAWWLERRRPEMFGRLDRSKVELDAKVEQKGPDNLDRLITALEARRTAGEEPTEI